VVRGPALAKAARRAVVEASFRRRQRGWRATGAGRTTVEATAQLAPPAVDAPINLWNLAFPQFYWVVAALMIVTILTVQGLGYLLPTNLRVYLELRRPNPNMPRIGAMTSRYFTVVAAQGMLQVAIIVIMARFATGI
jgi:hypothetical protein